MRLQDFFTSDPDLEEFVSPIEPLFSPLQLQSLRIWIPVHLSKQELGLSSQDVEDKQSYG